MKKLLGLSVAIMLGLTLVGCEDTMEDTKIEEPETKQEQQIEVEEQEVTEEVEDIFDEGEFNYYMTTNLTDEEYEKYFKEIEWTKDGHLREIEFDGHILMVTPHEKYNTRCELLLANGDYNNGEFVGPYIKTRDIAYTDLNGLINEGTHVKVKATIEEYDINAGYLKIDITEITAR